MHYRKFLWGVAMLIGIFVAAFLWHRFFPAAGGTMVSDAGNKAAQAWDNIASAGGEQNGQDEIVIGDGSSSDDTEGSATAVAGAPATTTENASDGGATASGILPAPTPVIVATSSASPPPALSSCLFSFPSSSPALSRKVIFNEIAWMGSAGASTGEWMEIKNISGSDVDLSGWELVNASGKIKILFGAGDTIPSGGLFLIARTSAVFPDGVASQKAYSGDLRNAGDDLALADASCGVSDFVAASSTGWPAGNNTTKQTMERDADGVGWHTSAAPGGTPGGENSIPSTPVSYTITISFSGSGSAAVTSDPNGMTCGAGAGCVGNYPSGTKVTLTVTHPTTTTFVGWSGACYNQTRCGITLTGDVDLVAEIRPTSLSLGSAPNVNAIVSTDSTTTTVQTTITDSTTTIAADSTTSSSSLLSVDQGHLLIAAVQIAGASTSNDFVKIYNPTGAAVDVSGWKLRKKSSAGTDASVREFPAGITIAPQQYFVWANSANGFAAAIGADTSSTQTLSGDNSVALIDATGATIDAVAWGTGTNQYGEGPPYPTNPVASQVLVRQSANGVMVDTDNNANDFTLQ